MFRPDSIQIFSVLKTSYSTAPIRTAAKARRDAVSSVPYIVTPSRVDASTRRVFDTGLIEGLWVVEGAVMV
jgi:hypothetical protein